MMLSAQTFTTLYTFSGEDYGPSDPFGGVIVGPQGELYGTTEMGGRSNLGTVYELLPPASAGGPWTLSVLHSFGGGQAEPAAGLARGPNGSLYGASWIGKMAFKLDPPTGTSTHWGYAVIHQFTDADGFPEGGLFFGSPLGYGQSLYGTTWYGSGGGVGSVYRLTPPPAAGGAWTYTTLYKFPGGHGGYFPDGNLTVGAAGTLFGGTYGGGWSGYGACGFESGCGTIFSLKPPEQAGGPWTEQLLHAFTPGINGDGSYPLAGVVIGPGGVLYGTAPGGNPRVVGADIAFSLTPPAAAGEPMTETILHTFGVSEGDGSGPAGTGLVLGPNGVLYGTTQEGGANGQGTLFELSPPAQAGGSWTETILYSFTGGADGSNPNGLTLGADQILYGTTQSGYRGANTVGTVFALTP